MADSTDDNKGVRGCRCSRPMAIVRNENSMRAVPASPDYIPPSIAVGIKRGLRIFRWVVLTALLLLVCFFVWGRPIAKKYILSRLLIGSWYPQMSFIPRSGSSVWEFRSDGRLHERAYIDANFASSPPVKPKQVVDSETTWALGPALLEVHFGAGISTTGFKILDIKPEELVLVDLRDHSPEPFQQRFARTCMWQTH